MSGECIVINVSLGNIGQFRLFISISDRNHANFNSKEVGIELAQSMLTLFHPTLDEMVLDTEKSRDVLLSSQDSLHIPTR